MSGSLAWTAPRVYDRQHNRVCVDCGAKLRSYDPHRTRCTLHESFRHDALIAIARMWMIADNMLNKEGIGTHKKRTINTQAVAVTIGMLSSPEGGFRGEDISSEISGVLPLRMDKIHGYVNTLKTAGYLKERDGWWHLDVLPYKRATCSVYTKKMRRGEHSLTAQDLVGDYLTTPMPVS